MSVIDIEKLSGSVGVEVHGVDLDRLEYDDELPAAVLEALETHGALVFRKLDIDDASQIAFSKKLGRVEVFGRGENPEIFTVTFDPSKNRAAAYLRGTFQWHIDGMTDDVPIMATVLSARVVAETGGETEFASAYQAYDNLSADEQQRFEQVRVVHTIEASQRFDNPDPTPEQLAVWRSRPAKTHPLVWRHASGRKSLVLGATASHVVGMEPTESRAFLDDLLERVTVPERTYQHSWSLGDLVIWDNRGVLHRVAPYDANSPREMHRTTLHGDEAVS